MAYDYEDKEKREQWEDPNFIDAVNSLFKKRPGQNPKEPLRNALKKGLSLERVTSLTEINKLTMKAAADILAQNRSSIRPLYKTYNFQEYQKMIRENFYNRGNNGFLRR